MENYIEKKGYQIGKRPLICVPVVAAKKTAIVEQVSRLARENVEMLEWRIDCFEGINDTKEVLEVLKEIGSLCEQTVLLVTYRSKKQGGEGVLGSEAVKELLLEIAACGCADLLDVEYMETEEPEAFFAALHEKNMCIVASHHDFLQTPYTEEMLEILIKMRRAGADIVKIAVMPVELSDVAILLDTTAEFRKKYPQTPLITVSMGTMGILSRICAESFGSCVTFGADACVSAPGQMNRHQLEKVMNLLHGAIKGESPNIYLIGFMGVGKSTVANALRRQSGMEIIDMDEELEKRAGRTIPSIFESWGEEVFRELEHALLKELAQRKGCIVSCGGGVILREENRQLMKQSGTVVQLTAEAETILERVKEEQHRPLLQGKKNVEAIEVLLAERRPFYEQARDVAVVTDGRAAGEIAAEILDYIGERS